MSLALEEQQTGATDRLCSGVRSRIARSKTTVLGHARLRLKRLGWAESRFSPVSLGNTTPIAVTSLQSEAQITIRPLRGAACKSSRRACLNPSLPIDSGARSGIADLVEITPCLSNGQHAVQYEGGLCYWIAPRSLRRTLDPFR